MSAATTQASGAQQSFTAPFGELFWRFLAVAMLLILEKLRLSESIEMPLVRRPRRAAKPVDDLL